MTTRKGSKKITLVIPALNEEKAIGPVIKSVPIKKLKKLGYVTEIMVIDNGSKDRTKEIATNGGANVIVQPVRGYGNAYKAGFANASGDIIATGDADMTYPFEILPEVIKKIESENIDFVNTDRLANLRPGVMRKTNRFGNWWLTSITNALFNTPFKDSQSGMWIFKRKIWEDLDVRSSGMPFSQELKIEAFMKGFKCVEIPIDYRTRIGTKKLKIIRDGLGNTIHLIKKRFEG